MGMQELDKEDEQLRNLQERRVQASALLGNLQEQIAHQNEMYERLQERIVNAEEWFGRNEEQSVHSNFLNLKSEVAEEKLEGILDRFDSDELDDVVDEFATSTFRLAEANETNSWLIALGEAGMPNDLTLRIWDIKNAMDQERRESDENS